MATIYNSDLFKELKDGGKIQTSRDSVPTELAKSVVPVMEVNPKLFRRINFTAVNSKTTTGSVTILTTEANRDFFITDVIVGYIKDAACDVATNTNFAVYAPIGGANYTLFSIPLITLLAQTGSLSINFHTPLKVDRSGAIAMLTNNFTAGIYIRNVVILGYYVDNPNA